MAELLMGEIALCEGCKSWWVSARWYTAQLPTWQGCGGDADRCCLILMSGGWSIILMGRFHLMCEGGRALYCGWVPVLVHSTAKMPPQSSGQEWMLKLLAG